MGCGNSQQAAMDADAATAVVPPAAAAAPPAQQQQTQTPQGPAQTEGVATTDKPAPVAAASTSAAAAAASPSADAAASSSLSTAGASASASPMPADLAASPPPVASSPAAVSPRPLGGGHHLGSGGRFGPPIPLSVLTDSYKASHFLMYPDAQMMVAYGEFRASFAKDPEDSRFVFYGMRYIVENYLEVPWTEHDVEAAARFYATHNAGFTPFPFPKDLFLKFVRENRGFFPVRIEALPEGTVANVHVPVYQIFAHKEYSRLITFLETLLTQVWYPSCVATLSRRTKDLIEEGFKQSVDEGDMWMADYKLHDFGMRGCTSVEQSVIGGCAHLLNFGGSDTMSACYYAQYHLNEGKPVATSIPATEHSVMTSWPNERLAMMNMLEHFGGDNTVFAIVMDSYDYDNALNKVLPAVAAAHKKRGGTMVLRPDSGDPVECILSALRAGEKNFPTRKNMKGFKVIEGMAAIQGDGINYHTVRDILDATCAAGFSAQNVAFGMGGGLLQRVNRDTMSFATKLSFIRYADGSQREVMKRPRTDGGKLSLPGVLKVRREGGKLWVDPRGPDEAHDAATNELKIVYDHGPVSGVWDTFSTVQARVRAQWVITPKKHNPVSPGLQQRIAEWITQFDITYAKMMAEIEADAAAAAAAAGSVDAVESVAAAAVAAAPTAADKQQVQEVQQEIEQDIALKQ